MGKCQILFSQGLTSFNCRVTKEVACRLLGLWIFLVQITVTERKLLLCALPSYRKIERARWEELQGPCKYYRCDIY